MPDLKDELAALRIEREPIRPGSRRWVGWVILLVVLAAIGAGAWRYFTRERPVEVTVATVTERAAGTQAAVLNAAGYVTARRRATVSSKITGKVIEVNVEEGMAVKEGQVLARLDDLSSQAALALAKAQLAQAEKGVRENEVHLQQANITLKRQTQLTNGGYGSQQDVDQAKTDVDATEARILALKAQVNVAARQVELQQTEVDNAIIRAPFSGIAISKDAQPGEMVSPVSAGGGFTRTGICTIVDMHSLEIEVDVNESYINRVTPGQDVSAVLDSYPDWQIPAHVITIVPTADRQKATVLVRIGFKKLDPRILPNMGVKVTFLRNDTDKAAAATNAQPVTLVPKAAIKIEGDASVAYIIKGDAVERRAVRTGGTDGDRVEVLAGLHAGDRVVLTPPAELKDGTKVSVK
ncbi:MAG TPA: efflux RND transporter periplasmic adaptor subunit [Vicinamibacterales bacterium]|nr:efflux RND transporter periplasmic adaptor subunit [Vicinamibacterales bacterium]